MTATTTRWLRVSSAYTRPSSSTSADQVEWATLTYVDWFNNRRLHGEIGMVPPAEFEAAYYRQNTPALVAGSQKPKSL